MRIYTSSWFTQLPATIRKIGISRGVPRGFPPGYSRLPELAPGPWFNSVGPDEYDRRFQKQLMALDARVIQQKIWMAAEKGTLDAALLCYESPTSKADWCHRGQVAAWLHDKLGLEVFEFGQEAEGFGHAHPKLYAPLRRGPLL